jgi:hypothetical protein
MLRIPEGFLMHIYRIGKVAWCGDQNFKEIREKWNLSQTKKMYFCFSLSSDSFSRLIASQ